MWWNRVLLSIIVLLKIQCSEEAPKTTFIITADSSPEATKIKEIETTLTTLLKLKSKEKTDDAPPKNCKEVQERGYNVSDVYVIQPRGAPLPFLVLCDMETQGGGWTYLLNRLDGSEDFDQSIRKYRNGFGNLVTEFWIGLDNIHYLTGFDVNELLFELVTTSPGGPEVERSGLYNSFSIGSEKEGYSIKLLGRCSGNVTDLLSLNVGSSFSTIDNGQCALESKGGWWYEYNCTTCYFTGRYQRNEGINWCHDRADRLLQVKMMVRPRDHTNPETLPHNSG